MSGYIGTQPVPQATQTRDSFTATSGQTSFATGGYTPNYLDVYLNGVKLSAADYTASNGSDVVLASGASTGDILEVVAFTTFNSASSSIDDNGNATALTIDSSENVMINTTDSSLFNNTTGGGFMSASTGRTDMAREANVVTTMNRTGNSDGDILEFRKDGTILGSIGVESNTHLVISTPSNGGSLIFEGNDTGGSDTRLAMENNTGGEAFRPYNSYSDNKYNLGSGSRRFKDLYLSSGIYLGGAGSANHLDDYEEGTWTPSLVGYSGTPAFQDSYYTKIGRFVFATCRVSLDGTSDGSNFIISNLPFTSLGSTSSIFGSNIVYSNSGTAPTYSLVSVGTTQINFYDASGTNISYTSAGVNKNYRISITYFTT